MAKNEYIQVITPVEMFIDEKTKLVFSVSKLKEGNPHIDIRIHVNNEEYKGPTKKGINFDTEFLYDFIEIIDKVNAECELKGL